MYLTQITVQSIKSILFYGIFAAQFLFYFFQQPMKHSVQRLNKKTQSTQKQSNKNLNTTNDRHKQQAQKLQQADQKSNDEHLNKRTKKKVKKGLFAIIQKQYQKQMGIQQSPRRKKNRQSPKNNKQGNGSQINKSSSQLSFLSEEYKDEAKQAKQTQGENKKMPQKGSNAILIQKQKGKNVIDEEKNQNPNGKIKKKVKKGLAAIIQRQYQKQMGIQAIKEKKYEQQNKQASKVNDCESDLSFLSDQYKGKPLDMRKKQEQQKKLIANNLSSLIQAQYDEYMGIKSKQNKFFQKNPEKKDEELKQANNRSNKNPISDHYHTVNLLAQKKIKTQPNQTVKNKISSHNFRHLKSEQKCQDYHKKSSYKINEKRNNIEGLDKKRMFLSRMDEQKRQYNMLPNIANYNRSIKKEQIKVSVTPKLKKVTFLDESSKQLQSIKKQKPFSVKYDRYERLQNLQQKMFRKPQIDSVNEQLVEKVKKNPDILQQKCRNLTELQKKQYLEKAAQEVRNHNFSTSLKTKISNIRNKNQSPKIEYKKSYLAPLYRYLS